ncbi:hypothetical protein LG200_04910 [Methylobacillus caricis]|uniref:hypothetical protein n=1 Tax=Methylobacillus caricis TaxID=1971611 RepID=UPI001CFFE678|nr:hypothetical protein [Methylobacillus caricis]MCB5187343.1 hypothetical protein [Methylobacillus caricis]
MQWYEAGNSLKEYLDKKSKNLGKITSVALNVMDEDKTYLTKKMQSFIGPHQGQAAKRIFNKNQYDTILFNEENNKP